MPSAKKSSAKKSPAKKTAAKKTSAKPKAPAKSGSAKSAQVGTPLNSQAMNGYMYFDPAPSKPKPKEE